MLDGGLRLQARHVYAWASAGHSEVHPTDIGHKPDEPDHRYAKDNLDEVIRHAGRGARQIDLVLKAIAQSRREGNDSQGHAETAHKDAQGAVPVPAPSPA